MGEVRVLPGVERRDIGESVPSKRLLIAAARNGVRDVVLIGRSRDGALYLAAEDSNVDAVVGKLCHATQWLASSRVEHK
jgi:hypothetical protein